MMERRSWNDEVRAKLSDYRALKAREAAMQKWVYMNERVPEDRVMEFLLERGREGWELCATREDDGFSVELIYKKPVDGNEENSSAVLKVATMNPDLFAQLARHIWPQVQAHLDPLGGLH